MDDLVCDALARILAESSLFAVTQTEMLTADLDTAVALLHRLVYAASVTVKNAPGTITYTEDDDYEVDYPEGTIAALTGGDIVDGQTLAVTYTYAAVYRDPPESLPDTPSAVVLETEGTAQRAAYQGLFESLITARVIVYAAPRVHLPEAIRAARPWAQRVLYLLATHSELTVSGADEPLGEFQQATWVVGQSEYAKTGYASVEVRATYRVDWQVYMTCSGIDTTTPPD